MNDEIDLSAIKSFVDDNIDLISDNKWFQVAVHVKQQDAFPDCDFWAVMRDAGINPLPYIDFIPFQYYMSSDIDVFTIPSNILDINEYAFNDCSIEKIIIHKNVRTLKDCAFQNCWKLRDVIFENGCLIEEIDEFSFQNCENINIFKCPDSCKNIGDGAFNGCTYLEQLYIPNCIQKISDIAFNGCRMFSDIFFDGTVDDWKAKNFQFNHHRPVFVTCSDGQIEV